MTASVFNIAHGESVYIAGLRFHATGIRHALGHGATLQKLNTSRECTLSPEPKNTHDKSAVAVLVNGFRVGYVPRYIAADLSMPLLEMRSSGTVVTSICQIRWYPSKTNANGMAGVHGEVRVAHPDDIYAAWNVGTNL